MDKLFSLLDLHHAVHASSSLEKCAHHLVNDLQKLIPYRQAIFIDLHQQRFEFLKVSGNSEIEPLSPYALSLKKFIQKQKTNVSETFFENHDPELNGCFVRIASEADGLLAGLWLERAEALTEAERQILNEVVLAAQTKIALLHLRQKDPFWQRLKSMKKAQKFVLFAFLFLALFPTRLTITAPAEVIARNSDVVAAPFEGTIAKVLISPGDDVVEGQTLMEMEDLGLSSQRDLLEQELRAAQSAYARLQREALANPEKRSQLLSLENEIKNKKIELDFATSQQEQSSISAPQSGVAIFSDAQSLEGRPIRTGDPLLEIANPNDIELLVRIPVERILPLDQTVQIDFYPSSKAFQSFAAEKESLGYQASMDPDGLLTYKLRARFKDGTDLRVGWQGTSKIKGDWTILALAILRQPLISLRKISGF
jgi:biotin carboxyl carrier protein